MRKIMEQEKHFRHICTAGLEKEIIFKTDADYIFGMNSIPVCMAFSRLTPITFSG